MQNLKGKGLTVQPYSWEIVSPICRERIETGERALERIDRTIHDWQATGEALVEMQSEAMRQSGANSPVGKGYNAAWAVLAAHLPKLADLDKATRSHAVWLAEHWYKVEPWYAELPPHVRRLINHPATVHRRYDRDHPSPKKMAKLSDNTMGWAAVDLGDDDLQQRPLSLEGDETPPADASDETRESWFAAFEALWQRGENEWRAEAASRLVTITEADDVAPVGRVRKEVEAGQAVDPDQEVRELAKEIEAMRPSSEPTLERLAMVLNEALTKQVPEDQIFAGLGDNISAKSLRRLQDLFDLPLGTFTDEQIAEMRAQWLATGDLADPQSEKADKAILAIRRKHNTRYPNHNLRYPNQVRVVLGLPLETARPRFGR